MVIEAGIEAHSPLTWSHLALDPAMPIARQPLILAIWPIESPVISLAASVASTAVAKPTSSMSPDGAPAPAPPLEGVGGIVEVYECPSIQGRFLRLGWRWP
jgi:hypothetical protein